MAISGSHPFASHAQPRVLVGFREVTLLAGHEAMQIQSFRDLEAWQLAMDYVVVIYSLTERFPSDERFGLTAQLRRAAVAIPSNISEGHQHGTRGYLRYVIIALGSAAECETQIEIARRLKYLTEKELLLSASMSESLRRILFGLRRSLRRKLRRDTNVKPER